MPALRSAAVLGAAVALLVLLAGCHPTAAGSSSTPKAGATAHPSVSASPLASASTAPVGPTAANAADYLVEGTPGVPDANGEWTGGYAFWVDESKSVRCTIYIFSGDVGGASCGIMPGFQSQRTYAFPSTVDGTCKFDGANSYTADGYSVGTSSQVFPEGTDAGFLGCITDQDDAALIAKTKVLPPNTILTVTQPSDGEVYACRVAAAVANCTESSPAASFSFGLTAATFSG